MSDASGIVGEFMSLAEGTSADLLAMQCGDFYEFFGEDAETVGDELDLKVSQKTAGGESYPMAGVPVDDLAPYLKALVERGYRVAVADQHETDDGFAREVVRVATPGTLLETTEAEARYLAAVVRDDDGTYGLAAADVTTGRFRVATVGGEDAAARAVSELYAFDPVEVLPGPALRDDEAFLDRLRERTDAALTLHEARSFAAGAATHIAREQFGKASLESLGVAGTPAVRAAGGVLDYVKETGVGVLPSMTRLQPFRADDGVELDATTQRNLELTETLQGDHGGTLLSVIDHTVTSPGGRRLRTWLTRPRQDVDRLRERQERVAALAAAAMARERIRDLLGDAYDLERLASKAVSGSADARDLLAVRDTLAVLPDLVEAVERAPELADSSLIERVREPDLAAAGGLRTALENALREDPAATVTQGYLLRAGYDVELDELIESHEGALEWIEELPAREKRAHGITHLQVDRNRTDGYYIQVGNSETGKVPESYREIKSLKNSTRYTTDTLEEREREILRLEEQRGELEYELFCELRDRVADRAELLQDVGRTIAAVDALCSLATHAAANDWVRPELTRDGPIDIDQGRHPVVEQATEFVPNDAVLDDDRRFVIVTGPNMSGKSTYMRQVALIVLLAQVGSFVPASDATVGVVDGIYTRVGALDELAQGRSTFMVEMSELSNILHSATDRSLVILDEVGRGTATYDGISIAWAATEYLHNEIGARTLFATHYHELTSLADHLERVANVHVAADEHDGEVTFLRTVREGATDRSYGIHVADLAGVPAPVVDRSRDVLEKLRAEKAIEARGASAGEPKQVVFDLESGELTSADAATADGGQVRLDRAPAEGGADTEPAPHETASIDPDQPSIDESAAGSPDSAEQEPRLDPAVEDVLAELREADVDETAPLDLASRVAEWQERLADDAADAGTDSNDE